MGGAPKGWRVEVVREVDAGWRLEEVPLSKVNAERLYHKLTRNPQESIVSVVLLSGDKVVLHYTKGEAVYGLGAIWRVRG